MPGTTAIENRLFKNWKALKPWADRLEIEAFRLYDRDIPEYPFVIEIFGTFAVLWNRQDAEIDAGKEQHLADTLNALTRLGFFRDKVIIKRREIKERRSEQYGPLYRREEEMPIGESGHQFLINLYDYLDCGLFLDHRLFRKCLADDVRSRAKQGPVSVLNLFCYTGSISVYAAKAGAKTTNVDLSGRYLDWAQRNFVANHLLTSNHRFIETDILDWVKSGQALTSGSYDVVVCDPPTFSNSKKMVGTWDVERDHVWLIDALTLLLKPDGTLYFSTNKRGFKLSAEGLEHLKIQNITRETLPKDFHDQKIRSAFRIQKRPS